MFSPSVLPVFWGADVEINTEMYRSGHNENDSKSVDPQGSVGSNPTVSATEKACNQADCRLFFYVFFYKQVVRAYRCFYKGLVGEVWAEAEAKNEAIEIEFSVYNVKAFT